MTLLWADGFEGLDSATLYNFFGATHSTATRFGYGHCATSSGGAFTMSRSFTPATDVYCGFAFWMGTLSAFNIFELWGDSATTQHLILAITSGGGLNVSRGGTVIGSSAPGLIAGGAWCYIEIHARVHDTTGAVDVRVNADPTPVLTFTGDTKNGGTNTTVDMARLGLTTSGGIRFDDYYISDSGFLGDVRAIIGQVTGAGSSTGLTPSSGANYQTVDEVPASASDYSGSITAGARDSYTVVDLPAGITAVKAVALQTWMHKSATGLASMKPVLRVAGTNYYGAARALNAGMTPYFDSWLASPNTSAPWTVAEVNGMEIGAEVV